MKYQLNNYVEALVGVLGEVSENKRDIIISNFVKLLHRTGDIRSKDKIIDAVHKKLVKNNGGHWMSIETARNLKGDSGKLLINRFSKKKDYVNFNINPELIAGIRVTIDGEEELDNSLNQRLNKLFK